MRFIFTALLFISLFSLSHLGYSFSLANPEGTLPRGLTDYFEFSVGLTGIAQTDIPTVDNDSAVAYFNKHVSVSISNSKGIALPYQEAISTEDFMLDSVSMAENKSETTGSVSGTGTIYIKYTVQIKYTASLTTNSTLTTFVSNNNNSIKVKVQNKDSTNDVKELTLTKANYVASDIPSGLTVGSNHKSLTINWTAVSSIKDQKGTSRNYTGTVVVVIDPRVGSFTFNEDAAKEFRESQDSDIGSHCAYDRSENGGECITCDNANTYLKDPTILNNIPGVKAVSTTASENTATVSGLENGEEYLVFAFFKPDGIKRTACYVGTPEATVTLTEFNGEEPAETLDKKCFIATAAYGSPFAENVKLFRWFRSTVLLKFDLGRKFVRFYYQNSPKLAAVIEKNELLKSLTRGLLFVPAKTIQGFQFLYLQFFANNSLPPPSLTR